LYITCDNIKQKGCSEDLDRPLPFYQYWLQIVWCAGIAVVKKIFIWTYWQKGKGSIANLLYSHVCLVGLPRFYSRISLTGIWTLDQWSKQLICYIVHIHVYDYYLFPRRVIGGSKGLRCHSWAEGCIWSLALYKSTVLILQQLFHIQYGISNWSCSNYGIYSTVRFNYLKYIIF